MAAVLQKTKPHGTDSSFLKLAVKISKDSFAEHYVYIKEHRVRDACLEKPQDRTLFVINLPPYYDDAVLKHIFKGHGEIEEIHFHSKPTSGPQAKDASRYFPSPELILKGYKVAYIVFKNRRSISSVLKLKDGSTLHCSPELLEGNSGVRRWIRRYNDSIVDATELQKEVDEYMEAYDESVEKEIQKAKETEGVPDSEGWITVSRHGKRPVIPRHEAVEKKISKKEKKKRSKKHLLNFYTFQIKQTKMDNIAQLRKKFEEDKKRIALMKMTRKFKPV